MKLSLRQKNKLSELLGKLGDRTYSPHKVIDELIIELRQISGKIPTPVDVSPFYKNVDELRGGYEATNQAITKLNNSLSLIAQELVDQITSNKSLSEKSIKEIYTVLRTINDDIKYLMGLPRGGGNANRQIRVNGTVMSTKYTDVDFINGSNVTITAADDNTNKRTNITITSSGSGGGGVQTPTGTIDGNNTLFVASSEPAMVFYDSAGPYVDGFGVTISQNGATWDIKTQFAPSQFIRYIEA